MTQPKTIPIVVVRQGGEQVVIGKATVNEQGLVEGQLERQALEEVARKTLGNVSFALQLPRWFMRRILSSAKGRHANNS